MTVRIKEFEGEDWVWVEAPGFSKELHRHWWNFERKLRRAVEEAKAHEAWYQQAQEAIRRVRDETGVK